MLHVGRCPCDEVTRCGAARAQASRISMHRSGTPSYRSDSCRTTRPPALSHAALPHSPSARLPACACCAFVTPLQMLAACNANDLPAEAIDILGGGVMEWTQHRCVRKRGFLHATCLPTCPSLAGQHRTFTLYRTFLGNTHIHGTYQVRTGLLWAVALLGVIAAPLLATHNHHNVSRCRCHCTAGAGTGTCTSPAGTLLVLAAAAAGRRQLGRSCAWQPCSRSRRCPCTTKSPAMGTSRSSEVLLGAAWLPAVPLHIRHPGRSMQHKAAAPAAGAAVVAAAAVCPCGAGRISAQASGWQLRSAWGGTVKHLAAAAVDPCSGRGHPERWLPVIGWLIGWETAWRFF